MDRKSGGKEGSRGGVRGRRRVCIHVWDMARWITQPDGQFITVTEREGAKERDSEERGKEREAARGWDEELGERQLKTRWRTKRGE